MDTAISIEQARDIQQRLAEQVILESAPLASEVSLIAGLDASISPDKTRMIGVAVVLSWPDLHLVEVASDTAPVTFPYVPGFLSFREAPVLLSAWRSLSLKPDIMIVDGQGIAHPRRCGLAAHIGVLLGIPSIGCAKSRLIGECSTPGLTKGECEPCWDRGEQIGSIVRTRTNMKPVWISPGHKVDHEGAVAWTMATVTKYRLPEVIRHAHREASRVRQTMDLQNQP